ncbi:hypothetical protein [Rufibacter tibetensis]|uniref:Uncharacterized protein n=1 Tax=Rufibacter tibetensis TaxID=512763 RepID=A0A0P0CWW4_9BACT|nr:hypothetical protein [Rufibacter tibetensis]ALI99106.1 hypothetical protein DC20_09125 [Rufibacter tibetensis]
MKKLFSILVLLCSGFVSLGQELGATEFYRHLIKAIEDGGSDSITLTTINYGCLGSQINWTANLKKEGKLVKVDFYSQKRKDAANPSSELETTLDTTLTVEKSTLKKRLEVEVSEIVSRPVFIEGSFKITVHKGGSNKEFQFSRGEGLSYILRYNETFGSYLNKR